MGGIINMYSPIAKDKYDFSPFPTKDAFMDEMRRLYSTRKFRFGYSGFLPQISGNDNEDEITKNTKDSIYKAMFEIGKDLGTESIPIKFEWEAFYSDLENNFFDTIIDPIISTPSRISFIFPYAILKSGIMLYHHKVNFHVQEYNSAITKIRKYYPYFISYNLPVEIKNQLYILEQRTKGFSARAGFLEWDILKFAAIKPKSIWDDETKGIDYSIRELNEGRIFVLDQSTFSKIKDSMDTVDFYHTYRFFDIMGSPIYSIAGFPVQLDNRNLQMYLSYHYFAEDGILKNALGSIQSKQLKKYEKSGITILSIQDMESNNAITWSPSWCNGRNAQYKKFNNTFNSTSKALLSRAKDKLIKSRKLSFKKIFVFSFSIINLCLIGSIPTFNILLKFPTVLSLASWIAFFGLSYEFVVIFPGLKKWSKKDE